MINYDKTRSGSASRDAGEGGASASREVSTAGSFLVMSLFLVALAGMWAVTYFFLLEA